MGRKPLSDDQRAQREAEKIALQATKKTYIKKNATTPQTNNTVMEQPNPTPESTNTASVDANPVVTETVKPVESNPAPVVAENIAQSTQNTATTGKTGSGFKVFNGTVKHRDYSTPKIDISLANTEIPEANNGVNVIAQAPDAQTLLNKNATTPAAPLNQQMQEQTGFNQLTPGEQQQSAAMAVDIALGAYDKLHMVARYMAKVSDTKMQEMERKGEIDTNMVVVPPSPETNNEPITIRGFVSQINSDIDREIVVSEDFKTAVRPAMERMAAKYGIGATDGVYLAYKFSEDIATKGAICYQFKKTVNQVIKDFSDHHMSTQQAIKDAIAKDRKEREAIELEIKKAEAVKSVKTTTSNLEESNAN
jgi:hypothetical protein